MRRAALYVRVSTDQQTTENQERELREVAGRMGWNVVAVFRDNGVSGAKDRDQRPGLDALLKGVVRREFDIIAAWSVDRLGRSLQNLIGLLSELHSKKIDLYLHQQGLDTTTPAGKAMFQMMRVFAEFERAIIQERVKSGLARARANGTRLGRPSIDPKIERAIGEALKAGGCGMIKLAKRYKVGVGTVQRIKAGLRTTP